jgi:large subunit ribosomal protein L7Ae
MPKEAKKKAQVREAPYKKSAEGSANPAGKAKGKKVSKETVFGNLFESKPRIFGIGGNVPPKKDLTRFVKWPVYVRVQRQKRVLYNRLKVPPTINQFTKTLDKSTASQLFQMLVKYKPEDKAEKKKRLLEEAQAKKAEQEQRAKDKAEGKKESAEKAPKPSKKPVVVKYGINHITSLVEQKKAKLVVIAHDVDPIELVLWLPALCRKQGVPYVIVKGKARLGQIVHKKTATALALVNVKPEDQTTLGNLVTIAKESYLDKYDDTRRTWGGGKLGPKSATARRKKEKAVAKEEKARTQLSS